MPEEQLPPLLTTPPPRVAVEGPSDWSAQLVVRQGSCGKRGSYQYKHRRSLAFQGAPMESRSPFTSLRRAPSPPVSTPGTSGNSDTEDSRAENAVEPSSANLPAQHADATARHSLNRAQPNSPSTHLPDDSSEYHLFFATPFSGDSPDEIALIPLSEAMAFHGRRSRSGARRHNQRARYWQHINARLSDAVTSIPRRQDLAVGEASARVRPTAHNNNNSNTAFAQHGIPLTGPGVPYYLAPLSDIGKPRQNISDMAEGRDSQDPSGPSAPPLGQSQFNRAGTSFTPESSLCRAHNMAHSGSRSQVRGQLEVTGLPQTLRRRSQSAQTFLQPIDEYRPPHNPRRRLVPEPLRFQQQDLNHDPSDVVDILQNRLSDLAQSFSAYSISVYSPEGQAQEWASPIPTDEEEGDGGVTFAHSTNPYEFGRRRSPSRVTFADTVSHHREEDGLPTNEPVDDVGSQLEEYQNSPCLSEEEGEPSDAAETAVARRPLKVLFGPNGILGPTITDTGVPKKNVFRKAKKFWGKVKENAQDLGRLGGDLGDEMKARFSRAENSVVLHNTTFDISLPPRDQVLILGTVELMLSDTANAFLMDQMAAGKLDYNIIARAKYDWAKRNRPQVIEFRYDLMTQLHIAEAHGDALEYHGPNTQSAIHIQSMHHCWRNIARELQVRTFCTPDSVLRKLVTESWRLLEMLGADWNAYVKMSHLQQMMLNDIASHNRMRSNLQHGETRRVVD